ncbi:hypothetical protein FQR65_LT02803 [Abscondita terminalis]|nr:hypothetical protein FQR65_LT02803 [Abscondita terminalis]
MTDTDTDAMLLENIDGKYGDGSDFDDLGNADEDALLADDAEFLTIRHSQLYDDTVEELDHEPEEIDTEDVLDLEVQDVELEEDLEEKNGQLSQSNLSVAQSDCLNDSVDDREREDRFKNEREVPSSKTFDIPDSLDKVQVVASVPSLRNNVKRNSNQFKNRGRGGYHNNRNAQNQTVLINPHFKGHVKINNNARLAWDARQRINQKNNQVGRIIPFSQRRHPNPNISSVQPWINNNNTIRIPTPNVPPFQHQLPVYQPPIAQPPQIPQQMPNNNQLVFMQPIPQNVYNQPIQTQFNQPPPQFTPYQANQIYSNPNQNSGFNNSNQFVQSQNHFNNPSNHSYANYPSLQQNQYSNVVPNNPQYNHSSIPFNNNNRINRQKQNFPQKLNKRKPEGLDAKRKKRNLSSANLHEVHTVEVCDTTVREEKPIQDEDEDEETRQYRLKIEEQKRKREEIFKLKEERRLKAIQNGTSVGVIKTEIVRTEPVQMKKEIIQQMKVHYNQPVRRIQQQNANRTEQICNSNINIDTNSDESNYDKQHLASFLANRKILTKDQSLIDTSIVVMKNLSAGTTEIKLRKMCQGIGDVKRRNMTIRSTNEQGFVRQPYQLTQYPNQHPEIFAQSQFQLSHSQAHPSSLATQVYYSQPQAHQQQSEEYQAYPQSQALSSSIAFTLSSVDDFGNNLKP